jgi:NAD dependent epimerase/dehydratase family enzyme
VLESNLEGVFNAVAPNPVQQKDFVKSVAKALNRPLFFPNIPEFVLNFVFGEMSAIVLESQRVSAQNIQNLGFQYKYHELDTALDHLL